MMLNSGPAVDVLTHDQAVTTRRLREDVRRFLAIAEASDKKLEADHWRIELGRLNRLLEEYELEQRRASVQFGIADDGPQPKRGG